MKKYLLLFAIAIPTMFSSCLKDKNITDKVYGSDGIGSVKVVEIKEAPETEVIVNVSTTPLNTSLLTITSGSNVTEDLTITLIKDDALIPTPTTALPATEYTLPSLQITIPKGSNTASLPITLKNTSLLLGTDYALAFKIGSVSNNSYGISQNYKTVVSYFTVKNSYAGTYDVTFGGRYNYAISALNYIYPTDPLAIPGAPVPSFVAVGPTKEVETIDATRCAIGIVNLGGAGFLYKYIVTIPAGSSGLVDLMPTLQYSSQFLAGTSNRNLQLATYNHDTKEFKFALMYNNNPVPSSGAMRLDLETLKKQ